MKSLPKPWCVIALLACKLAQGAVAPPPVELNTCPQHAMQQMLSGNESMQHAPCCKFTGCDCLQSPALAGPGLPALINVGASDASAPVPSGQLFSPAGSLFRPPIP